MKKRAFLACFVVLGLSESLALAAEPIGLSGVFRPSWTPSGDFQLALDITGPDAEAFVHATGTLLARAGSHIPAPTFLGERLSVSVRAEDATVIFPTGAAKSRLGRAGTVACIDSWYATLSGPEKLTLDAIVAGAPGGSAAAARELSTSAVSFVQARNADCGADTPTRLNDSLMVDVPRYVALKASDLALGDLTPLDSVLGETYRAMKNGLDRNATASALAAARAWAADLRSFGFTSNAAPSLAAVLAPAVTTPGPANARTRASIVLDVLRATASAEVAKAALASGEYRPLRPSLRLSDTLLDSCTDGKGNWNAVACAPTRVATEFRWLELKSEGVVARYLLPPVRETTP